MSQQLDHKIIDEMNTKFRMKICELAGLQADALPLKGESREITIDHQVVADEIGIALINSASYYVVQFIKGDGFWEVDRITAYQ